MAYFYKGDVSNPVDGKNLFRFYTASVNNPVFNKLNNLSVYVDGRKLNIGKPIRIEEKVKDLVTELLLYEMDRSHLEKIFKSKTAKVQIGKYTVKIDENLRSHISNLLDAVK